MNCAQSNCKQFFLLPTFCIQSAEKSYAVCGRQRHRNLSWKNFYSLAPANCIRFFLTSPRHFDTKRYLNDIPDKGGTMSRNRVTVNFPNDVYDKLKTLQTNLTDITMTHIVVTGMRQWLKDPQPFHKKFFEKGNYDWDYILGEINGKD